MPAQPAMSQERLKKILITVDAQGKPQIDKNHETITLDRTKNEEVIWESNQPFRIDFQKDLSPFYEDQFDNKHAQSGLVRRGVISSKDRVYRYTIDIKGKTLDPGIKVYP